MAGENMRVKIFTTGGTIDKTYFDAKSRYEVGDPQITTILKEAHVTTDVDVEALFRKDSLDLSEEDRAYIAERVKSTPMSRVLITHGTDTMVQMAKRLEREVNGKTVVLVGALSPARFKESDAVFNIGFAFSAVQVLGEGVHIAMNGRIFEPGHVRKNLETNRFEYI